MDFRWLLRVHYIAAAPVCDPAMGSGSFLAAALRFLTEALFESLYHHDRLERKGDGAIARLADGLPIDHPSQQTLPVPLEHETFEEQLRARLKRHIVERCIYGVDLDPLAVELGRMALWVETMDRSLPFGFLDHKLKVGNSLVGAWLDSFRHYPAMAWAREGGDKDYQKNKPGNLINHYYEDAKGKLKGDRFTKAIKDRKHAVKEQLIAIISRQRQMGDDTDIDTLHSELESVFEKLHDLPVHETETRARVYQDEVLNNPNYAALKDRLDLWCALWFWPGASVEDAPLPQIFLQPGAAVMALSKEVAFHHRFFHWELEFPDVFTPTRTGFDGLIGNPPWEIQKPNSKEFFSNIDPFYRAYGKQEALGKQLDYFRAEAEVEHDWIAYNGRLKALSNWVKYAGYSFGDRVTTNSNGKPAHDFSLGGRGVNSFQQSTQLHDKWAAQRANYSGYADEDHPFRHQGSADLNTYKLFLELGQVLLWDQGRMGFIVPSGVYTDKGTTQLRELFLNACDWQWLFGFENREGIFDIHRSFKFCALIVQKGGQTQAIRTAFMHRNVDDWEHAEAHVLAYPRERVEQFSPYSKAILEIRSEKDLAVLTKLYANGVLLGDQSEAGWGIQYTCEFHMTNDSKLFPPIEKWEKMGYLPDEYGHWLKGPWQPYIGPRSILERVEGLVLSRDGTQALDVEVIEDVALPLYEGRMIGQFDFSEKGWVEGKGRSAVWRDISFEEKVIEPQYIMALEDYSGKTDREGNPKAKQGLKVGFLAVGSATNSRSMFAGLITNAPAGNAVPVLQAHTVGYSLQLMAVLNSYVYDYILRNRLGGLNLNYFVLAESLLVKLSHGDVLQRLSGVSLSLGVPSTRYSATWFNSGDRDRPWYRQWALTVHERLRLKCISEAVVASEFGLQIQDFGHVLSDVDLALGDMSNQLTSRLNSKGFWRIDKDRDPELRHTVLSLIAFQDLQEKGMEEFLKQNEGEGWMIPETLRLADYGLGHDDRAKEPQPVASRLGPRFYDWQLEQDVEESWEECRRHADLINRIVPPPKGDEADVGAVHEPAAHYQASMDF